ncbi:unnamed protein product [Paramecium pentaurelia]|uniref:Uncharacterized protein n=1 Tax=Paramecium pentaurelia TaxID=43138 RepID=A0A8S1VT72_9CILI|nr:unnamed protein product [Paramecium pentaurelia]
MSKFKHNVEDVMNKLEQQIKENRRRTRTLSLAKQNSFNSQCRQRLNTMHHIADHFLLKTIYIQPQQDIQQRKKIVNQRLKIQQRKYYQQLFYDKTLHKNQKTEVQPFASCITLSQLNQNAIPLPIVFKQKKEIKKLTKPNSKFNLN